MSCILDKEMVINSNELIEYLLFEMSMNKYTNVEIIMHLLVYCNTITT